MVLAFCSQAFAQTFNPDAYVHVDQKGNYFLGASLFASHSVGEQQKVSLDYTVVLDHRGWGEALFGISGKKGPFIGGFMVGFEANSKVWRINPWALLQTNNRKGHLLLLYEHGGSGYWFRAETGWKVFEKNEKSLSIGTIARRYHGVGPRIDIGIQKAYIWCSPGAYDWEKPAGSRLGFMLGVGARL